MPAKYAVSPWSAVLIDPSNSGVLTLGPRFVTCSHGAFGDARCATQRSGIGGLNGPGRFDAKYSDRPSREIDGVMSKNGLEMGAGKRTGASHSSPIDLRRLT